jgi:hypothetical protein
VKNGGAASSRRTLNISASHRKSLPTDELRLHCFHRSIGAGLYLRQISIKQLSALYSKTKLKFTNPEICQFGRHEGHSARRRCLENFKDIDAFE